MKRFDKELEILLACEHGSIIAPLGVLRSPPTYALVLPVYAGGALFTALHASGRTLSVKAKLAVSRDVAAAIAHLHTRNILHRDVKSDNVLLDSSCRAVLADFNAAEWESQITADIVMQARPTGGFFKQFVVGTLPYMAPELLRSVRGAAYARSCDCYSLGITMNEVCTQTVPYSDAMTEQIQLHTILEARYNNEELTRAITVDGIRPAPPDAASVANPIVELGKLAAACWQDTASSRPVVSEVAAAIDALLVAAGGAPTSVDAFFYDGEKKEAEKMDVSPSDPAAVVDLTEAELRPPIDLLRDVSTTLGLRENMALRVGWGGLTWSTRRGPHGGSDDCRLR